MALTRLGSNQSVNLANNVTGTLPAANGGTGATSFDAAGLVLLSTTTLTSASSVTVNPPFSSTYKSYRIIINGISPATSDSDLHFTFIKSDGSEDTAANYRRTIGGYSGGTDSSSGSETATSGQFGRAVHNDSGTVNADMLISNPTASIRTSVIGISNKRPHASAYSLSEIFGCWMNVSTSYTQIKFYPSSGNWNASGTIMVYGQKNG
tara:strand:- start:1141 stop:1764 length:624 start_codon:yes stop_codon:yes gene_type:complete